MTKLPGLHPAWVLTTLMSTFLLISIIPLSLLFIMTCVAGLPTADPTPDLADRSLDLEARPWNYESDCKVQTKSKQCQFGVHTLEGSKNVDILLFDPQCNNIGRTTIPTGKSFSFASTQLPNPVEVNFVDPDNPPSNACIEYKKKSYYFYQQGTGNYFSPDGKEQFVLWWFPC